MLDAIFGDAVQVCAAFIEACGTVIPPRTADDEPRAMQRDRGPELRTALQDGRVDRAETAPAITAVLEEVHRSGGMHALNRLSRRTDGQ